MSSVCKFELERLSQHDSGSLIAELRRVASLLPQGKLKRSEFDRLAKVHSSTLHRRFGTWQKALVAAGLGDRFDDRSESWSRDEILIHLRSVAQLLGRSHVTKRELLAESGISSRPISRLFGSYRAALNAAGLSQSPSGVRYTDEECFENLLNVWMALGRQPFYSQMTSPPSRVGPKAYVVRWGSWRKALEAFVDRANRDTTSEAQTEEVQGKSSGDVPPLDRGPRGVPLGLRYAVLNRDRFRCVLCGRSPATHTAVTLHVDHIIAWSRGGKTVLENLRCLCGDCNLGKGAKFEEI